MHGYSTDSGERRVVPLLLALLAIALAWVSSKFLASIHLSMPGGWTLLPVWRSTACSTPFSTNTFGETAWCANWGWFEPQISRDAGAAFLSPLLTAMRSATT